MSKEVQQTKLVFIELENVVSSNVRSIGYDKESRTAFVKFYSNAIYAYEDVSFESFTTLRCAHSVGKALNMFKEQHSYKQIK
jgi:hypothetical protein